MTDLFTVLLFTFLGFEMGLLLAGAIIKDPELKRKTGNYLSQLLKGEDN